MAGRDVDDTQTAMAQSDIPVDKRSFIVRPAMSNHIAHALEHVAIYLAP
jgi:hypothetical protein